MKITLCFYGQPRNFEKSFPLLDTHILSKHDTDIFFHLWWDKDECGKFQITTHSEGDFMWKDNTDTQILDLYKPKKYILEKFVPFIPKRQYNSPFPADKKEIAYQSTLGRFLSTKKCIELAESYEKEHSILYDLFILTRTDIFIQSLPSLNDLDLDKSYSKYTGEDFLYIISRNHIIFFKDMFDNIDMIYDHTNNFYPEDFFPFWFKTNGIYNDIILHKDLNVGVIR